MNIAVAQSGGPTCAINASLVGVFRESLKEPAIDAIFGSVNGVEGIIQDHLIDLKTMIRTNEDMELLRQTPSTVLGSCRYKLPDFHEDSSVYEKIAAVLKRRKIGAFFYIGGNDSMDTVQKLSTYFKEIDLDVKVIGIPKTIDNDLCITDHTPGFGSAAKYVATTLQEIIRDSRVYSIPSVTIVEIMGRDAGWLTASSCVLRANGEPAPHLIYLPESDFSEERYLEDVKRISERYKAVIVAVSEGIDCLASRSELTDAFGHKYLSGVGKYLEELTRDHMGCKVRSIELNVMQRCGSHIASLTDLDEAWRIGAAAVNEALKYGGSGIMMGFRRISNNPYRVGIAPLDVRECANKAKYFPKEWITPEGNNVTIDALNYFLPLIQGEPKIDYRNGIPVHFRLDQ